MGESLGRDDPKFPHGRVAGQHRRKVRTGSPSELSRYCSYYQAFTGVIHLRMVHLIICGTGDRKSVGEDKRVAVRVVLGGRRNITKQNRKSGTEYTRNNKK